MSTSVHGDKKTKNTLGHLWTFTSLLDQYVQLTHSREANSKSSLYSRKTCIDYQKKVFLLKKIKDFDPVKSSYSRNCNPYLLNDN